MFVGAALAAFMGEKLARERERAMREQQRRNAMSLLVGRIGNAYGPISATRRCDYCGRAATGAASCPGCGARP